MSNDYDKSNTAYVNRWPIFLVTLGVSACVVLVPRLYFIRDDAYIVFAYAQNWVGGHGIVFNAGERVEGYTCFSWVALCALGLRLGVDIVWWSVTLGAFAAAGAIVGAYLVARELFPGSTGTGAGVAALLVGSYPPLAYWAGSGLETTLFTCLVTLAIWQHVRNRADSLAAPILLALAAMTRPEGMLLAVVLGLDAFRLAPWPRAARYCIIFLVLFAPYYGWRYRYYGYPLPNTFYTKVGNSWAQVHRGLNYTGGFVLSWGGGILVSLALLATVAGIGHRAVGIYVFLLAYGLYIVSVGGDRFFFFRFFVPVVPTLAALGLTGVESLTTRLVPSRRWAGWASTGAIAMVFTLAGSLPMVSVTEQQAAAGRALVPLAEAGCRRMKAATLPSDLIATPAIGYTKYCTRRPVLDMLGLADKHIAHQEVERMGEGYPGHEKSDGPYVLARWPKYILIPERAGYVGPKLRAFTDLWENPIFQRYYVRDALGYRRSSG